MQLTEICLKRPHFDAMNNAENPKEKYMRNKFTATDVDYHLKHTKFILCNTKLAS